MNRLRLHLLDEFDLQTESHEDAVSRYYGKWSESLSTATWYNDERVFRWLDQIVPLRPQRVLELCCGSGAILHRLASRLPNATFDGVDICETMFLRASHQCASLPNVRVFHGDWLSPLCAARPYDVVLVKNSLHLIRNLHDKLVELRKVCHPTTRLVLVETVSPSSRSRSFVQNLFKIVDEHHVKSHYFIKSQIKRILEEAGWTPSRDTRRVDQLISVNRWLNFKMDSPSGRRRAIDFVSRAPRQIREEMNISSNEQGVFMLRRQLMLFAFPRA